MVTFTPQVSHARFGQQQPSIKAMTQASTIPMPGHDHLSLSKPVQPQIQFGELNRRKVLGLGGALGLGALLTACGVGDDTEGTSGSGAGAEKTDGAKNADPVSAGSPVEKVKQALGEYKTSFKFPTSAEIDAERPDADDVAGPKARAAKLKIHNEEMPHYVSWVLTSPALDPQVKTALPPNKQWIDFFADPASAMFLPVAENRKSLDETSLYPQLPSLTKLGRLINEPRSLGQTFESVEAALALFMLKTSLPVSDYDQLVNNSKLAKDDGTCIQFYDFADRAGKVKLTGSGAKAQANVDQIFKDNKDLAVLVADWTKLEKSKLDPGTVKTIGQSGVFGGDNLVIYVDTGKLGHDPAKAAIALVEGLQKAKDAK